MLKYLYLKNCLICNKKGTNIKNKKNIVVLKTQNNEIIQFNHDIDRIVSHFNLNLDLININDIVCRKHINQLNRDLMNTNNDNININNNDFGARYDENNNIETYEDNDDYSSVESFKFNQQNDASSSTEDECSLNEHMVLTNDSLVIDVKRTTNSHRYCFVCGIENNKTTEPFRSMSTDGILDAFIKTNVLIGSYSRCCHNHLTEARFLKRDEYVNLKAFKNSSKLTKTSLEAIFKGIRTHDERTCSVFSRFGDFSNIDTEYCSQITSFDKDEFILIISYLKTLKNSPTRTKEQALSIYLFWLTTGSTQKHIALFFGLDNRFRVQKCCEQVRQALLNDYVPNNLGSRTLSRNEWIQHNSNFSKSLFDLNENQFSVVADGTYLYCEKSQNNKLQKELYSMHKYRHLIKPFVVCSTDG